MRNRLRAGLFPRFSPGAPPSVWQCISLSPLYYGPFCQLLPIPSCREITFSTNDISKTGSGQTQRNLQKRHCFRQLAVNSQELDMEITFSWGGEAGE
jgi:hypothetical protein